LRTGNLSPAQWSHLEKQTIDLGRAPLFIDDTPALSVYEFRSKARRLKTQHDIKLIIIDYLQLMTAASAETRGNREQEVSLISRTLKAIAKELDVPIIALSQLSRNVENRGGSKRPQLSDLRESGAIEQDADVVAFIHRPEYYGLTTNEEGLSTAGMAEIIIAKHRNGEVTDVPLRFIKEQAKFADADSSITNNVLQQPIDESYETISSSGNNYPPMSSSPSGLQSSGMSGAGVPSEFDIPPF
jgi:replicative DNA helicase